MQEKITRKEQIEKEVEIFLNSTAKVLKLRLYGREIKALEKKYPILITKESVYRGALYNCLAYKRKE